MTRNFRLAGPDAIEALRRTKVDPETFEIDRTAEYSLAPLAKQWRRKASARVTIDRMIARSKRPSQPGDEWARVETQALRDFALGLMGHDALDLVVKRSRGAIRKKAQSLGLVIPKMGSAPPWTADEIAIVRAHPAREAVRLIDRNLKSIQKMREKLGLTKPVRPLPRPWTDRDFADLATPEGRERLRLTRSPKAIERAVTIRNRKLQADEATWTAIRAETGFVRVAHLRAEIEAEAFVRLRDGIAPDARSAVRAAYTHYFGDRFVSLDDTGPGGDGQALIDRLDGDTFHL